MRAYVCVCVYVCGAVKSGIFQKYQCVFVCVACGNNTDSALGMDETLCYVFMYVCICLVKRLVHINDCQVDFVSVCDASASTMSDVGDGDIGALQMIFWFAVIKRDCVRVFCVRVFAGDSSHFSYIIAFRWHVKLCTGRINQTTNQLPRTTNMHMHYG